VAKVCYARKGNVCSSNAVSWTATIGDGSRSQHLQKIGWSELNQVLSAGSIRFRCWGLYRTDPLGFTTSHALKTA